MTRRCVFFRAQDVIMTRLLLSRRQASELPPDIGLGYEWWQPALRRRVESWCANAHHRTNHASLYGLVELLGKGKVAVSEAGALLCGVVRYEQCSLIEAEMQRRREAAEAAAAQLSDSSGDEDDEEEDDGMVPIISGAFPLQSPLDSSARACATLFCLCTTFFCLCTTFFRLCTTFFCLPRCSPPIRARPLLKSPLRRLAGGGECPRRGMACRHRDGVPCLRPGLRGRLVEGTHQTTLCGHVFVADDHLYISNDDTIISTFQAMAWPMVTTMTFGPWLCCMLQFGDSILYPVHR